MLKSEAYKVMSEVNGEVQLINQSCVIMHALTAWTASPSAAPFMISTHLHFLVVNSRKAEESVNLLEQKNIEILCL